MFQPTQQNPSMAPSAGPGLLFGTSQADNTNQHTPPFPLPNNRIPSMAPSAWTPLPPSFLIRDSSSACAASSRRGVGCGLQARARALCVPAAPLQAGGAAGTPPGCVQCSACQSASCTAKLDGLDWIACMPSFVCAARALSAPHLGLALMVSQGSPCTPPCSVNSHLPA